MTEWNSLPPEDVPRPAPPEPAFPVAGTPPPLPPPDPLVQCWRCNKQTSALKSRCVYCDATVVSQRVLPPVPFEGQPLPPVESPADPAQVICWRCGKSNSVERSHCAFCSAAVVRPQAEPANPSEANLYAWLDSLPAPTTPPPPPFY